MMINMKKYPKTEFDAISILQKKLNFSYLENES